MMKQEVNFQGVVSNNHAALALRAAQFLGLLYDDKSPATA
jgi:hypothetical protein